MKLSLKSVSIAAAIVAAAVSVPAHAGLTGSNATFQYYAYGGAYSGDSSPSSFTVDGGAHAQFFNFFNITVTDTQIIYDYIGGGTWSDSTPSLTSGGLYIENGSLLSFAGAPAIASVTVDAATNMAGFSASNVTFNGSQVAVTWTGLNFDQNTDVVLNISAVPEPSTYLLMGLGLAATLVLARRRRQG